MRSRSKWGATTGVTLLLVLGLSAPAVHGSNPTPESTHSGQGASATVLETASYFGSWTGFDPPVTTSQSEFEPYVLGQLFDIGPHYSLVPDLATGYSLSDGGLSLTITLRHGVTFSNGDPFNSSVVAFNMKRDVDPTLPNGPLNAQNWPMSSVDTPNDYTVVVHFSTVFAPVTEQLNQSALGYMVDPVALQKMGEDAYNLGPIGAGPFEVVNDKPGSSLVLKRNPTYWHKGYPKLGTIRVETVGSDESGYDALLAGQGQIYEGLTTITLADEIRKADKVKVYSQPPNAPFAIQFNTSKPPFNNILAREAIFYATNRAAIETHLYENQGGGLADTPTGPASFFYEPKLPGYRTYNLAKAKALVKQLGGLHVDLGTVNVLPANEVDEALQAQWNQAGITTTLSSYNVTPLIGEFRSGNWQAMSQAIGGYDPALGLGLAFRFGSASPLSGVHDPKLDAMMNQAAATLSKGERVGQYRQIFTYLSNQAYALFLWNLPFWDISTKNMTGVAPPAGVGGVGSVIDWMKVGFK